ncbi:MAG: tetratricopeptide repeat protein [Candidatus Aminicenantes bacterium]|nr:tetratricopeptide repeat protein [Candidatus Aminicenantes bacterium]
MNKAKKKTSMDDYQKALSSFSKAMKFFRKQDFDKAKQSLDDLIKEHSEEMELIDRAKLYLEIIKHRKEKESPTLKSFEDLYQYGIFRMNQGKHEQALDLFQKANKKKPKQGKVYYAMADTYCLMGDKDKCISSLKTAIQLDEFYGILAQNETDFDVFEEDEEFNSLFE